ncbi:Cytidylate kinase [archaeon HR06]|nr:Cytidylate kinase [archaeon HR06]
MLSIIISGMPASGKSTLAQGIAKIYHLKFYSGGDALKELAKEFGFSEGGVDWWDKEEGMKFLRKRKENYEIDKKIDDKLISLLKEGNVVITSYPLAWLYKDAIKIWLKASQEKRIERVAKRDNISLEEAKRVILVRDEENKLLYRELYGIRLDEDLSVFDLVINTDILDDEKVLRIVCKIIDEIKK